MGANYICHSGGCAGSDMEWETQAKQYGIKTISYSFPGHVQEGENQVILTPDQLNEGWKQVTAAEKGIKRSLYNIQNNPYVLNLLCRNWYQVRESEAIYAIGYFFKGSNKIVNGGTGWAIQMAINNKRPVYLFEQKLNQWFTYYYPADSFVEINAVPSLTQNFAGIGTREINESGKNAIKEILAQNIHDTETYGN
jgi:hypothetical protein